jgi:UDP-N-acetylglucosamine 4,6-dehydratase
MKNPFKNKTLLITGATGSFGNAMINKVLKLKPKEIRVFSRDEKKQEDLRESLNNKKIKFFIGDTRQMDSLEEPMKGSDIVFHAAALKQVPSCEFYPIEAIKTNILGTENSIKMAIKNKVKNFILLSTDKAVYPINSMGLTKALAEKVLVSLSRQLKSSETILCATRYGNVMASRGSVIPKFVNQIINKKDITITDPEMTRFMMSLEDSINLVIHALNNGNQGDIFVQKSPSATIKDIAHALKKIYKSNVSISYIGIRHGEKKYETLVSKEEMLRAIDQKKYFKIISDDRDLNYSIYFSKGTRKIKKLNEYNSDNTKRLKLTELINLIKKIKIEKYV